MNDFPRQTLRRIVAKYGAGIGGDARRCESLLKDLCGSYVREINVLVNAIDERVPHDLLAASLPPELLLKRLEKRLEEQTAMTAEAAAWTVETWALALNVATENEIEARRKRAASTAPVPKAETLQPKTSGNENPILNQPRKIPARPPQMQPSAPPSKVNAPMSPPPVIRQPKSAPTAFPPVFAPTNNPPVVRQQPSVQPQTTNPPVTIARRSFGFFRGCLFVTFLLIVSSIALFFVVPYAIEVMRETQRERNNEPPRFPGG